MLDMSTDRDADAILADIETVAAHLADIETEADRTRTRLEKLWREAVDAGASYRQIGRAASCDHTAVYYTLNGRGGGRGRRGEAIADALGRRGGG
jgi:hypothetical protein